MTAEAYNDPTYIQWVAQYIEFKDGSFHKFVNEPIDLHPCTLKDLQQFHQDGNRRTSISLDKIQNLFCLNKEKLSLNLFKSAEENRFIVLDVKAIPCRAQECNNEKQKAIDYLNNASIVVYYNRGDFKAAKFEKPPIAYSVSRREL